ncbi:MAG: hypothetical protein M1827_000609 [Pycnora praestabilis]|nr:MAG: hypothetical protein M1827_000609 [Pycnora praestabilis]
MSMSDSSSLSSAPSTDDEASAGLIQSKEKRVKNNVQGVYTPATTTGTSPVQRKRPASPSHEYVLADNADLAFITMFRSRFNDAFPKSLTHYGPQDIEKGVVDSLPSEHVENLLCALLGLVLNRKKYVERGHYNRALEEAVQTQKLQWPTAWSGKNPLSGGKTFSAMSPTERLTLLKTLVLWSLSSSEAVQGIIKESYKQVRHDDDLNQPLSVQPWGRDGDKRRYWLIEGQDDTHFRLYRESNPALKHNAWWSVAGTIEELKTVGQQLQEEGSQAARRLSERIILSVPRFEATEEKRKRREYRTTRKAQFTRPEPGFSLYEGRTRGKRMKYTYSDEDEEGSDATSARRSYRQSGASTPAELTGPTFTASGRQVRSRAGGVYGETALSGQNPDMPNAFPSAPDATDEAGDPADAANGRPRRSRLHKEVNGWGNGSDHIPGYNSVDEMDDEDDAASTGGEWDGGDDDEPDDVLEAEDEEEDEDVSESDIELNTRDGMNRFQRSLVVQLKVKAQLGSDHLAVKTIKPSNASLITDSLAPANGVCAPPKDEQIKEVITVNQLKPRTDTLPNTESPVPQSHTSEHQQSAQMPDSILEKPQPPAPPPVQLPKIEPI